MKMAAIKLWRGRIRASAVAAAFFATLSAVAPAIAQDYVKVDDAARDQLPAIPFVAIAYGFIWIAILGYVFLVARGLGRVHEDLKDLRRRLDDQGGDPPAKR
jgi:CcmD family protein